MESFSENSNRDLSKNESLVGFARIFESQYEMGILDELTLDNLAKWRAKLEPNNPYFGKIRVISIQPFGIIDSENIHENSAKRPDPQNVQTTKNYLNQIIHHSQSKNPCIILITGNGGWQEGWIGGESISTANYLAKELQKLDPDWQEKYFLIPCGIPPVENLNYYNNLLTAKNVLAQINQKLGLNLEFEALWTDFVRILKHIIICFILKINSSKVKTTERLEIDNDGNLKNRYLEIIKQTGSLGITLWHLFQH